MIVKEDLKKVKKLYTIEFENRPEYLYVYVEGDEDSLEITTQYWSEVLAECHKYNCQKVLIEENINQNVTASEMYEFAKDLPNMGFGSIVVAFVDRQIEHHELNRFGELVATNRGLQTKVFNNFNEAEQWLLTN